MLTDEQKAIDILKNQLDLNIQSVTLVTYSLTNLNHSQKTLFGYALKGRTGQKGFVHSLRGEPVGRNNILIPSSKLDELKEFFATWKVNYQIRRFIELNGD